jgi:hypothetical protein
MPLRPHTSPQGCRPLQSCASKGEAVLLKFALAGALLLAAKPAHARAQDQPLRGAAPSVAECRLFDPLPRIVGDETSLQNLRARLLETYNAQSRLVRSLKTTAQVHIIRGPKFGKSAGKSKMMGAIMDFQQPAWLRATGVAPPGGIKLFDMASDGREFRLLAPDHNKMTLFVGPAWSQPDFTAGSLNLRPQEFLDALRWGEGKLTPAQLPPGTAERGVETLKISLPPRGGKNVTGKLRFDLAKGTVSSLTIYNAEGALISDIHYADWRLMSQQSGQTDEGCFPRRVQVIHEAEDFQIDIRILEMTLNPPIDRATFRISAPRGVPTVHVAE